MSNELEAFLEYISITKALSKKSVEAYTSDLTIIEDELSSPLIRLDSQTVLKILSRYKNKRTLNRKLSSVNAFFDFCYKHQFRDEVTKIKSAKIPKLLPRFLSYDEIKKGLELCDKTIG
jgi:integrase/recombinase XerD